VNTKADAALLPRPRNLFHHPYAGDQPLAEGQFYELCRRLEDRPLVAQDLRRRYEWCLAALNRAREVRREEDERLQEACARALAHNAELDARLAGVSFDDAARLQEAEARLADGHDQAASAAAGVGVSYDPERPERSADALDRLQPDERAVCAAEGLPAVRREWATCLLTPFIGALLGLSLGLVAGVVTPARLADKPLVATFLWLVGSALAASMNQAVGGAWRGVGEGDYLGARSSRRLAVGLTVAFIGLEAWLEAVGLLKFVSAQSALARLPGAKATLGLAALWPVALAVSAGYLVCSAYQGYRQGRLEVVLNRVRLAVEKRRGTLQAELGQARLAVSRVLRLRAEAQALRAEKQAVEERRKVLEAQRLEVPDAPSAAGFQRIQDAWSDYQAAMLELETRLARALATHSPDTALYLIDRRGDVRPWLLLSLLAGLACLAL